MLGKQGWISQVKAQLALNLVERYGLSLAEAGRQLGVSAAAISKIFLRNK
jgi:predicted transcriptional regulator